MIFEAARSTLLAMRGDEKLPSLKTLQAEQQRLLDEQQRLYDERAKLKKEDVYKRQVLTWYAGAVFSCSAHQRR